MSGAKTGPLSDETRQAGARKRARLARATERDDLRWLLSDPRGRRLFWGLLDKVCGVFASSFAGDPLATAHGEGRRRVGIELMLRAQREQPRLYALGLAESLDELRAAAEDEDAAEDGGEEGNG